MITTPAPKRERLPVIDPISGTQISTTFEPIDRWIYHGWVAAREQEPKPVAEVIALDSGTHHELLMEVDSRYVAGLLGQSPKIYGMDVVTDPDVDGYEIRTATLDDWAEQRVLENFRRAR